MSEVLALYKKTAVFSGQAVAQEGPQLIPLFRLAVRCPHCGAFPRIRITLKEIHKWQDEDPEEIAFTYQCHWRLKGGGPCKTLYTVPAKAVQHAQPA